MRRKFFLILILLLFISDSVFGKNGNRTKPIKPIHKNRDSKYKINNARVKRFLDDSANKILSSDKEHIIGDSNEYENYLHERANILKLKPAKEKDAPFWGTRGRRESFSDEIVPDVQLPNSKQSKHLYKLILNNEGKPITDSGTLPFWSSRGRRGSDDDDTPYDLFWANRGRRQDEEPFWGTRGRRQDDSPFWGNRDRQENSLSRQIDPTFGNSRESYNDYDEPFWGNRGRRQEPEPFWGTRGRRDLYEPFWGGRGKKKRKAFINQKSELRDAITAAINDVRNKITNMERNKKDDMRIPFWINRGRDSKIKAIFNGIARNRMQYNPNISNRFTSNELQSKTYQQNTIHDDRIYAEEPHYILVERSSRSSAEDDPFFITRGKKHSGFELAKGVRDRRGALEEIVKSVRNDPYYIARGKKDYIKVRNSTTTQSQFLKTRDLICSTVDLFMTKYEGKVKRQANDNERDRRTTLKKLALQLQMDPYYVSRGKKNVENNMNSDTLENFINKVVVLCN